MIAFMVYYFVVGFMVGCITWKCWDTPLAQLNPRRLSRLQRWWRSYQAYRYGALKLSRWSAFWAAWELAKY